jgi:hypothetical protein
MGIPEERGGMGLLWAVARRKEKMHLALTYIYEGAQEG